MDRFEAMRVFTRIVERRSFTRAADDLGLPRSSVTDAVKGLELRLGVRLLQRSTRHVSPTLDGEADHRRCVNLISDLEDAEAGFTGVKPSGLVRIDVHGTQARHFLLPGLPRFLDAIRISACTSARRTTRSTWCAKGSIACYAGEAHGGQRADPPPPGDARARHLREPRLYKPVRHARVRGCAGGRRAPHGRRPMRLTHPKSCRSTSWSTANRVACHCHRSSP